MTYSDSEYETFSLLSLIIDHLLYASMLFIKSEKMLEIFCVHENCFWELMTHVCNDNKVANES